MNIIMLPISDIVIERNRQRQEFDGAALASLSESIQNIGLLHPIIIEEGNGLRTGERRYKAISNLSAMNQQITFMQKLVPLGLIPCMKFSSLTLIQRLEIEYDENHQREALTWQEQAKATTKLNELRTAQADSIGALAPTIAEIAAEVRNSGRGANQATTRKEIIVSKHLHRPEIAKAKNVEEAFKLLKDEEKAQKNEEHGRLVGATFTKSLHSAFQADCQEWMRSCPDGSFDVILTDPPYGMDADTFGTDGNARKTEHKYSDDWESIKPLLTTILQEGFRVTKPQAHIYMFCDLGHFDELRLIALCQGWTVFRTPMIWHKPSAYRAPWPEHGPKRQYECILYAIKGKMPVTALYSDVLTHAVMGSASEYGAQKPVPLFSDLLRRSCQPGFKVLDPCMGSGTIFEAGHSLKCIVTGIEKLDEPYGIATRRLEELK